jgi:hypothetical protein
VISSAAFRGATVITRQIPSLFGAERLKGGVRPTAKSAERRSEVSAEPT